MRGAVLNSGQIVVREDLAEPVPGPGDVLVAVRACGICGSDLHFAQHASTMVELAQHMRGLPGVEGLTLDLSADVHLGHEFAVEVLDGGSGLKPGTLATSMPCLLRHGKPSGLGYSNTLVAGYAEEMLVSESLLLPVANGLPAHIAALTEPLAVGLHAVNRAAMTPGQGAIVVGCGPVGLAITAELKAAGVAPIVAVDFSPARRRLAEQLGADEVVDAANDSGPSAWRRVGNRRPPAIFEAVGVTGSLGELMREAPAGSRIIIAGVCMQPDVTVPWYATMKELDIRYAFAYSANEFATALAHLSEGVVDGSVFVTDRVPLDRVAWAFSALGDPETHCKIIVEPGSKA